MLDFDAEHITTLLRERYVQELGSDGLQVLAPVHHKRLCLRVVIETADGARRWIFEAGVSRPEKKRDESAARQLVVNFVDAYLSEWFTEGRSLRPTLDFTTHTFQGQSVFLRGRRRDLKAERLAAEWLGDPLEVDLEELD